MTAKRLKKRYLDFFVKEGHKVIPNVSLVPEDDPSALFISAGMHPLVPYLLGEPHPQGKRLVSVQRCLRTTDIDEVGDVTHNSFFEMLGNWSLGDYWKKEAISLSFEFLTSVLKISPERLYVTCFAGDKDAPKDEETAKIWQLLGIPSSRIFFFGKRDNWWGPAGKAGPCGPDTEMFVDTGKKPCSKDCKPGCFCGKYFEVWNDVFMEYNKTSEGKYEPLKQKNVDTGMGVERTTAVLQGKDDVYQTELFIPIVEKIEELSGKSYEREENNRPVRIIADHLRAAVFAISDGVRPSNVEQGYVLRRLIRRAIRSGRILQLPEGFTSLVAKSIVVQAKDDYPQLEKDEGEIIEVLGQEEQKFQKTLSRGLREIEKYQKLDGKIAFYLYETYGFPLELTEEIARERGQRLDKEVFKAEFRKHQELSRARAEKKFAGGLSDHSEEVKKLHTTTHLLHTALRRVLGERVFQKGSNITAKRLRFDFSWQEKLSPEQLKKVEKIVNQKIKENLPVEMEMMSLEKARQKGALALFAQKYGRQVKTYWIGKPDKPFSFEVCGGPHVSLTGTLGKFKIVKEESAGAQVRRIYATLA